MASARKVIVMTKIDDENLRLRIRRLEMEYNKSIGASPYKKIKSPEVRASIYRAAEAGEGPAKNERRLEAKLRMAEILLAAKQGRIDRYKIKAERLARKTDDRVKKIIDKGVEARRQMAKKLEEMRDLRRDIELDEFVSELKQERLDQYEALLGVIGFSVDKKTYKTDSTIEHPLYLVGRFINGEEVDTKGCSEEQIDNLMEYFDKIANENFTIDERYDDT